MKPGLLQEVPHEVATGEGSWVFFNFAVCCVLIFDRIVHNLLSRVTLRVTQESQMQHMKGSFWGSLLNLLVYSLFHFL